MVRKNSDTIQTGITMQQYAATSLIIMEYS